MHFQFYGVTAGEFSRPSLTEIPNTAFEIPPSASAAKWYDEVMARFNVLIRERPEIGNIVVISDTICDPPGGIIAAEVITTNPSNGRRLQWLYSGSR